MADLYVKKFDMINPFVVASSPATQGALNVLKSAKMRPRFGRRQLYRP